MKKVLFSVRVCPDNLVIPIYKRINMNKELLHKYFDGKASEKEEVLIVEWVRSSEENKEQFRQERLLYDMILFADSGNIRRKPKGHLFLYPVVAIVAMLALVFVMDLPHMYKPKPKPAPQSEWLKETEEKLKELQKEYPFRYEVNREENSIEIKEREKEL